MITPSIRHTGITARHRTHLVLTAIGTSTALCLATVCIADINGIDLTHWCYNQTDSGTPGDWQSPGTFHLTSLSTCQARSIFFDTPQDIRRFTVTFTYLATNAGFFGCEHGSTFTIQNSPAGCHAVGGTGGSLGYAPIPNSAAVSFQMSNSTGFFRNGSSGGAVPVSPVFLRSAHPIDVTLNYDGNVMTQTLHDTVSGDQFVRIFPVGDLAASIGSTTAYIGFTGSTTCGQCSGNASNQYFSNFRYFVDSSCPADVNQDGTLNSQDFFSFIARFLGNLPEADFNRDGFINTADFFDYVAAFFAGCP